MAKEPEEGWEQQCFGCSQADHRRGIDQLADKLFWPGSIERGNVNLALGSILSDVQEMVSFSIDDIADYVPGDLFARVKERLDRARQHLNRVKDAIFNADPMRLWVAENAAANQSVELECRHVWTEAAEGYLGEWRMWPLDSHLMQDEETP